MNGPEGSANYESIYESLSNTEFSFRLLRKFELIQRLKNLVGEGRFTPLGKEFYVDLYERLILTNAQDVHVAASLHEAAHTARSLLSHGRYFYITGGLEGIHHLYSIEAACARGISGIIMGLETPEYIVKKGREPLLTLQEKISLWRYVLPQGSMIFIIPPKPPELQSDEYYDWIGTIIGVFRNQNTYYSVVKDEPLSLIEAKRRRAFPGNLLYHLDVGVPLIHTTALLAAT